MDVTYVLIARLAVDRLPQDDEHLANGLVHRDEVAQVVWAKRQNPRPKSLSRRDSPNNVNWAARPTYLLDLLVLLNHRASEATVEQLSAILRTIPSVRELEVRHPDDPPQQPVVHSVPPPVRARPSRTRPNDS